MYTPEMQKLEKDILKTKTSGEPTSTKLKTSERILARVTDGIYRQPSSALRELISNAYDADATSVVIHTDAPRFEKITIHDNGNGMSPKGLSMLIKSIGGTSKRTWAGVDTNVVNAGDPSLSPNGRKLIGKIGIGLFSIAQLSHHFQIITKQKGSDFRIIADITLKTYTEEELGQKKKEKAEFNSGDVSIWTEPATDLDSHGTDIYITDIPKKTKQELRSQSRWKQIDFSKTDETGGEIEEPKYHIGRMDKDSDKLKTPAKLPWDFEDPADTKFKKLVDAVIDEYYHGVYNPQLDLIFDNYLKTIWTLSLSSPLDYLDKHPFDITGEDDIPVFLLSNNKKEQAKELKLSKNTSIREALNLKSPERGKKSSFEVIIDGIKLKRPIKIINEIEGSSSIKKPMLFVGKYSIDKPDMPKDITGGHLSFESYLLWTPVVVPKQHRGVMVRISDSSGDLFDETFLKYQVSEQTRLRQITSEIYVLEGLEAALNIDRESFNYAHPHYQILAQWVHNAIRQFANVHKKIGKDIREKRLKDESRKKVEKLDAYSQKIIRKARPDDSYLPPEVVLLDKPISQEGLTQGNRYVLNSNELFSNFRKPKGKKQIQNRETIKEKTKALIKVLDSFGVFAEMSPKRQKELVQSILEIFYFEEK